MLMVVKCSPAEVCIYETFILLKYANQVKKTIHLGGDLWLRHSES